MSEISIIVDLPGRRMSFSQDESIVSDEFAFTRDQALRLLERTYLDARSALLTNQPEEDS